MSMGLVGILLAVGIIGGVTALQKDLSLTSGSSIESSPSASTTTSVPTGLSSTSTQKTSQTAPPTTPTGLLAVQLTDPPSVPSGVTHVYLNYSEVDVHISGVGMSSGWYAVANSSVVDLMNLINVSMTLGSASVSSGVFTSIRFDVNSVVVTFLGKNYSAEVLSNHLRIPVSSSGVVVTPNGSAGVLIDFFPTVVPVENSSTPQFVLVPTAKSLAIPGSYWDSNRTQKGDKDSSNWWSSYISNLTGPVVITSASLSQNLLDLTVENTGTSNVSLTGIAILENFSTQYLIGGEEPEVILKGALNSTTTLILIGAPDNYYERLLPVATFEVLSNGSLVQPSPSTEMPEISLGYTLSPGQVATLTFNSQISTLSDSLGLGNSSNISSGNHYLISVLGCFVPAYIQVNAT